MKRVHFLNLLYFFVLLTICGCDVCPPQGGGNDDLSGYIFFTAYSLGAQRPAICYIDANGDAFREISASGTIYSAPSANNKIAFLAVDTARKKNMLYLGNIFGGSPVLIEEDNEKYSIINPILSPDGNKIAFFGGNSKLNIWINDPETNSPYIDEISASIYDNVLASFSPDGKLIAYVEKVGGRPSLVIVDVAAPDEDLFRKTFQETAPDARTLDAPVWTPDGAQLTYVTQNDVADLITIVSVPGFKERSIPIDVKALGARTAAAFNGARHIVFTGREGALWMMTLDGDKPRYTNLTESDSTQVCLYPQWSDNGKYIIYNVFSSLDDRDAHSQIALIELNLNNSTPQIVRRITLANNALRGYWKK
ncbi:MAG: TolB family protein [Chloroflexota bacterium]